MKALRRGRYRLYLLTGNQTLPNANLSKLQRPLTSLGNRANEEHKNKCEEEQPKFAK